MPRRNNKDLLFWLVLLTISALVPAWLLEKGNLGKPERSSPLPQPLVTEHVEAPIPESNLRPILDIVIGELQKDVGGRALIGVESSDVRGVQALASRTSEEPPQGLEPDLLNACLLANATPIDLSAQLTGYSWITTQERKSIFKKAGGWKDFHRRYPQAVGFITVSKPGFDISYTQCLVYGSSYYDGFARQDYLYRLIGDGGHWRMCQVFHPPQP